ncbi:MAG: T9SS type A sorting domain-containing protein, partial [Cytophagia bacterium]|nr:T9SS type A sorting domain-containing protein [Cytophagia bacterium]
QANGQSITIADDTGVGTITNDDQSTLSISDITKVEGNSGTTDFTFSVTMTGAVDQQVTVDYATSDGTATIANGDYNVTSGTLTFSGADGESQTITVAVNGDATEELNESFTISLSNIQDGGKGVVFAKSTAVATIANDDDNVAPSGFSVSFDDQSIGGSEVSSSTFTFSSAEVGTVYSYSITSAGGGTTVTGSGTIATTADQISIPDLSGLHDGVLTLLVTLTDGSSNISDSQRSTANLDKTGPIPVITSSSSGLIFTKTITATITFNEEITGLTIDDLSATNSVLSNFTGSGTTYTVLMTASADGEMTLTVPANVAADGLGNKNTVSNTLLTKVEAFSSDPTDITITGNSLIEKEPGGTVIGELAAIDADDNDRHTFSLVSGEGSNDNALFVITGNELKSRYPLDYQSKNTVSVRVRATDLRSGSVEKVISIEIVNIPEPRAYVTFVDPNTGRLYGNFQFPATRVGTESTVTMKVRNIGFDGDLAVSEIKLPSGFEVSESELTVEHGKTKDIIVTFKPTEGLGYGGVAEVISNSITGSYNFNIGGIGLINSAPIAYNHSLRFIGLNRRIYLNGFDPDRDDIQFVITQNPSNGTFTAVDLDGGALDFSPSAGLDPGLHRAEFKFKVVETEGGLESEEASGVFEFYIQDTWHTLNKLEIVEKTSESITFDLQFSDEVVNASYSINLGSYNRFFRRFLSFYSDNSVLKDELSLGQGTHNYQFTLEGNDFETVTKSGFVSFVLKLRSDVGYSTSMLVRINNSASGSEILVVDGGTDEGDFFVFGEEKSLQENESVEVDMYAVEFGGFSLDDATIEITDPALYGTVGEPEVVSNDGEIAQWKVAYTSTSDTERRDSIGFTISHPGRSEQYKAYAVLDVVEVADEPTLSEIEDQQIQEDEELTLELQYSDPDSQLEVTATSSDAENVNVSIQDGILTVAPAENYNGNVSIAVTVTEADSQDPISVLETFNLSVIAVNDKPVMASLSNTNVDEDSSIEIQLNATDVDSELSVFDFTTASDKPESVELSIEGDVLTITPVADYNGDLTLSVKADDGEGTLSSVSEPETFVLKVNPVNDSPEVSRTIATQSIVEGLPAYTIELSDYFSDPDVESSELTYTVGSVSNVSLTVNGSILTIQSVDGAEGLETVTITASDGVLSASQDVSFVASASSDEITVVNALSDLNLEEDFDLQVIDISDLFAYSNDANAEFTYQLSGNNSVSAAISGTSLEIGALENFNGTDQLYIIGSTDGISAYSQININVSAVNDAPELVSSISDLSVLEDVAISRVISNNIFSDVDGDVLTYSAQFDADWLSFDASTRTFSGTPQNDDVGTVEVTLTAEDPYGAKATDTFQIVVSNTNDDPTDIGISVTAFDENISVGTVVASLSGTDPDAGDADFGYSLISGTGDTDNSSFEIVDGQLKTLASFNYESKASYSIRVKITDGFEGTFEKAFTISVNNVNEVATDITLATAYLTENQLPGAVINGLATVDPDLEDTHIYSLVAGEGDTDNESFEIVGGGLASKVKFNFEKKSTYSVRVRSIDAGGLTFEKAFTINVSDANDAPSGVTSDNLVLAENESIGTEIGTLSTTDEDASDSYTYVLVAGIGDDDNSLFGLENGKLVSKGSFNFETKSSYSVRVKSSDSGGLSVEEALTITILDTNDAPTAVNSTLLEIAENKPTGTVIAQFTSIDEDTSDDHTYSLVSGEGDADNDSFEFDGWNLKTKESFNFETKSSYSIRVQSSDGNGGTLESQFTVNVTNVLEVELRTESSITVPTIGMGEIETVELVLNNDGEDLLEISSITFPEGYSGSFTTAGIIGGGNETLTITFEPTEAGTYTGDITITSNAGTNTVSITGEAEVVAGIEDPTILPSQVKLYPNPASQFVEIDLTDLNGIPADLSIKSINGVDMWNKKEVKESKVSVDISSYADGAYLILIQTDRGTVAKRLLIKK